MIISFNPETGKYHLTTDYRLDASVSHDALIRDFCRSYIFTCTRSSKMGTRLAYQLMEASIDTIFDGEDQKILTRLLVLLKQFNQPWILNCGHNMARKTTQSKRRDFKKFVIYSLISNFPEDPFIRMEWSSVIRTLLTTDVFSRKLALRSTLVETKV